MSNEEGNIATAKVTNFANKISLIPTAAQKLQRWQKRREDGIGTVIKEANYIQHFTMLLAEEGLTFVNLTREVEKGKVDGYMIPSGEQGDAFVGVNLTFSTRGKNNSFTIGKSKQEIVTAVLDLQLIFVWQLYVAEEFCGAVVFTPEDSDFIESLPNSSNFQFSAIGRKYQYIQADCLYEKLLPYIFVWKDGLDNDEQEAKRFVQHISKFLSVASTKYSKEEFAVMLSDNHLIEHKYTISFKTIFADAARMPVGQSGDFHFKINGVQVGAELRMIGIDHRRIIHSYHADVYKPRQDLATIVNSISMFVFVFASNVEVPHSSKVPADYSRFICIPARTHDGQVNICHRHVTGTTTRMQFHFDPGTGVFSNTVGQIKNIVRDDKDYLVLNIGESLSVRAKAKLEEWARRPKFQAAALPATIKKTVVESSSDDDEPIPCRPTDPKRRRIMIHDSD
jgi:hypothetical protein